MRRILLAVLALLLPLAAEAANFSFAVIPHPTDPLQADATLREALHATDAANLAFVVANGIKAPEEACSDALYSERESLLQHAQNGIIVSLAASDWTSCKDENGRAAAIGRLNRMRELFFPGHFSFGASKIPLVRQSSTPRYRGYPENAHWEIGGIMFATINLPSDNNHYLFAAGRNSEFEDRVIANRNWLHRVFSYARYQKLRAVVLFADGDPLVDAGSRHRRRDGYREIRAQLLAWSKAFHGRVLLVHNPEAPNGPEANSALSPSIDWHGRLGEISAARPWTKITVNIAGPATFSASAPTADVRATNR